jgi:hypothetical protein
MVKGTLSLVLMLLYLSVCALGFAQSEDVSDSVPGEVLREFKAISFWKQYRIDYRVNPFYLRADFDGDSKPDFAVLCVRTSDKTPFIAMVLSKPQKTIFVALDPEKQMDGWEVFSKSVITRPQFDAAKPPPRLMGDAVVLKFSITLLLYWDGREFGTYALSD